MKFFRWLKLSFFVIISSSCNQANTMKVLAKLPTKIKEASGIIIPKKRTQNTFITLEDSGNKNVLYHCNLKQEILSEIKIKNSNNIDWESLTTDIEGNWYIGDFGNNKLQREYLQIYWITKTDINNLDQSLPNHNIVAKRIDFKLPDQEKNNFEGFIFNHINKNFYIFSKEKKQTKIFSVQRNKDKQIAKLVGSIPLSKKFKKVTDVAYHYQSKQLALLSKKEIKIFKLDFEKNMISQLTNQTALEYQITPETQKESIAFKDAHTLWLLDEASKRKTGNVYKYQFK